jgi:hypothetical protein
MGNNKNEKLEKVLDFLGEVLGFLTVVLYAVLIINGTWQFIPQGTLYNVLVVAKSYAALAVVAIVGLEAAVKRGFLVGSLFFDSSDGDQLILAGADADLFCVGYAGAPISIGMVEAEMIPVLYGFFGLVFP